MRLLLTRPLADSGPLRERLEGLGHECLIEPLLDVRFNLDPVLDAGGAQALLFTSANGVRALEARSGFPVIEDRAVTALPALAVGAATAEAAREAGFTDVRAACGDVDKLADLVVSSLRPKDGALLHAAGTKAAGNLAGRVTAAGFVYRRAVLYEAGAAEKLSGAAVTALAAGNLNGVLLFSPRTAKTFAALVQSAGLSGAAETLTAFCLSENVRRALGDLPGMTVKVAETPDTGALLALI